jgi:hypothetical protein
MEQLKHTEKVWAVKGAGNYSPNHCKENPIYVFPEKKLRGLSPNFHIHVSESNLYSPTIGPPIFLQQNRQTDRGNIKIAHQNMNGGIGNKAA